MAERIQVTIEDVTYWVVNLFCHKCRRCDLQFLRWGKAQQTAQLQCSSCGGKEWRKAFRAATPEMDVWQVEK